MRTALDEPTPNGDTSEADDSGEDRQDDPEDGGSVETKMAKAGTGQGDILGKWFADLPEKVPNLKTFRLNGNLPEFPLDFIGHLVTLEELDLSDLHMDKAGWVKAPLLRPLTPLTQVKTFGVTAYVEEVKTIEGDFSILPMLETFHAENTMPSKVLLSDRNR
ncbi:hypothetical protein GLOTRDRAFT_128774 [Gloeophyllum trabeum ATCC 11539]|uniref:L domain-like protein n=1 Tax=Gloeophyllum trabeum (strain ATCC 11539 / FP-39264 / Madison 617) TaxID=670483 RepID=S7RRH4_GLOTA|nr:uncharacterized protein GLOTRDRAFT_128774 [Gloeophyllum trabeum ATCC 11539]EPQ55544.1 hypothetical protein GLOTRDRAFT_128774 [Gloeophyllum trabeum ATCC 11539]